MKARWHTRWIDPAILLGLILTFFWKIVFTRQYTILASPDISQQVLPWLQVQALALRQGTIALWDPFVFFGQSLIGQVQPAVTSPFTYLLIAAPLLHGHINLLIFHIWFALIHYFAALFAWFFFRDLGLSRAASIVGGLFYALAGYVGTTGWPQMLSGAIWGPLVFMFLLRSLRGRRPIASAAYAGFFLGCSWLSGHHQSPLYLSLAAISIPIYLIASQWAMRKEIALRSAIFMLVTGLTALVQLLPAAEYARLSVRWTATGILNWNQRVGFPEHQEFSLRPADLLHFILPGGGSTGGDPIVGIVGAMLVILAIMAAFQRFEVRLFTIIGIAAILLAMARNDVLYGLLYVFVPLIEKSREPVRMLSVAHLCIAGLVAFGADVFLDRLRVSLIARAARWAGIFALVTFSLWFLIQFMKPTISSIVEGDDRPLMVGLVAALLAGLFIAYCRGMIGRRASAVCLALLIIVELGNGEGYAWAHKTEEKRWAYVTALSDGDEIANFLRSEPQPLRTSVNRDDLGVNFGDWYGIDSVEAYLVSLFAETNDLTWWSHRLTSMFGVNYMIARNPPSDIHQVAFTAHNGIKVFRNPDAFPRAWAVHRLTEVKDAAAAVHLVRDGSVDLRTNAVLAETPPSVETCSEADRVGLVRESFQTADFGVSMACRGLVVLSDSWYPGWRASVDGSPAKIYKANSAIRGVVVEKGTHNVHFAYRPMSVYLGFAGTLMGIAIVIFLGWRRQEEGPDLFSQ